MGPVIVVDHTHLIVAFSHKQLLHLRRQRVHIGLHLLQRLEGALTLPSARIADRSCSSADQDHRTVSGKLEAFQHHKGDEMADMHAVARRVNTAIE
ncbi:hypothetical protein D3C75_978970 [compost metagenome]